MSHESTNAAPVVQALAPAPVVQALAPCISVLKFGGTSVKSIARMQHVAGLIGKHLADRRDEAQPRPPRKLVVVVSAMGDTTDHLVDLASQCCEEPDKRELDVLLSTGEQVSIALLSIILRNAGIRAKSFTGAQVGVLTESCHGSARILEVDSSVVCAALEEVDVVVVAGFQGVTLDGDITTLGRGGSDTSAVALAAAVKADECHIFTDVDGIYDRDPNKFADAEFFPEISYEHCLHLAQSGAQVMHDRAVSLAKQYDVKVRVRNTFKPDNEGTVIQTCRLTSHVA